MLNPDPSNPAQTPNAFAPPRANLEGSPLAGTADQLTPASRWTRLGAAFLDGLLFLPCGVLLALSGVYGQRLNPGGDSNMLFAAVGGLLGLGLIGYQVYLLATRGQTLGKRWTNIKIVKLSGENPGFVGAVLIRSALPALIGFIPLLGPAFRLVDALFIFRDDRRCVHDLMATTRVVQVPPIGP